MKKIQAWRSVYEQLEGQPLMQRALFCVLLSNAVLQCRQRMKPSFTAHGTLRGWFFCLVHAAADE
ncbi:hypothetical protein M3223_17945 [Paenibacillus pasadenensis]|nr:hypothetical protein [Paenibacillus pasadenensis]